MLFLTFGGPSELRGQLHAQPFDGSRPQHGFEARQNQFRGALDFARPVCVDGRDVQNPVISQANRRRAAHDAADGRVPREVHLLGTEGCRPHNLGHNRRNQSGGSNHIPAYCAGGHAIYNLQRGSASLDGYIVLPASGGAVALTEKS
jgi:hypothetical protein